MTSVRPAIADLDSLPFPARHLCDNGLYRMPDNGRKMGVVLAGKGCPRECIFCLVPAINGFEDTVDKRCRVCYFTYYVQENIFDGILFLTGYPDGFRLLVMDP